VVKVGSVECRAITRGERTEEIERRRYDTVSERRRMATQEEVASALRDLDGAPERVAARDWPGHLRAQALSPGLYSWWVDGDGSEQLADGLGAGVAPGRLYAGQAGATKWPSGKVGGATLATRVGGQHARGRVRSSTFRLTLASALRDPLGLVVEGPRRLAADSERDLSEWIATHLHVAIHPFEERDALMDLEHRGLDVLDPPLNLEGRPPTDLRAALSQLRGSVGGSATPSPRRRPPPTSPLAASPGSLVPPKREARGRVTLHEEIADILRERGGWMTAHEVADAIDERGRYSKKDGSAMSPSQVRLRAYKYNHLFELDRSRVRLRNGGED
jgi:hypothetical protein